MLASKISNFTKLQNVLGLNLNFPNAELRSVDIEKKDGTKTTLKMSNSEFNDKVEKINQFLESVSTLSGNSVEDTKFQHESHDEIGAYLSTGSVDLEIITDSDVIESKEFGTTAATTSISDYFSEETITLGYSNHRLTKQNQNTKDTEETEDLKDVEDNTSNNVNPISNVLDFSDQINSFVDEFHEPINIDWNLVQVTTEVPVHNSDIISLDGHKATDSFNSTENSSAIKNSSRLFTNEPNLNIDTKDHSSNESQSYFTFSDSITPVYVTSIRPTDLDFNTNESVIYDSKIASTESSFIENENLRLPTNYNLKTTNEYVVKGSNKSIAVKSDSKIDKQSVLSTNVSLNASYSESGFNKSTGATLMFNDTKFLNPLENHNKGNFSLSSSIVISIALSLAVALIILVIVALLLLKFGKHQRKIYLSYELSKPRTYITKPMKPSILAQEVRPDVNEVKIESARRKDCQRPIYLNNDVNYFPTNLSYKSLTSNVDGSDSGIDNRGFSESSLRGSQLSLNKIQNVPKIKPPKYSHKKKLEKNVKVIISSDGSQLLASPYLTKCLVAPPKYAYSLRNESITDFSSDLHFDKDA